MPEFDYPKGKATPTRPTTARRRPLGGRLAVAVRLVFRRPQHPAQPIRHRREPGHDPSQHPGPRANDRSLPQLDRDPYMVISDGRLFWIQDAYTTSDWFPYAPISQPAATSTTSAIP